MADDLDAIRTELLTARIKIASDYTKHLQRYEKERPFITDPNHLALLDELCARTERERDDVLKNIDERINRIDTIKTLMS